MAKKKNGLLKFAVGVGAAAVAGKVAYDKVKAAKNKLTKEEQDSAELEVRKYNAVCEKRDVEIEDEEFMGCEVKAIASKLTVDLSLAVTCDIDKKLAGVHNYVENTDEEGIHTVYIIGKAVLSSVEVIPVNFYVDDEDVEEDFDDDAAFPESDDVEVKVINETKENQEKEDDTEETEDVLEGIEIEDDSDVDKTETINLEEVK